MTDDLADVDRVEDLHARMVRIRERIADAGADPSAVRLVAVTKGQPAWAPMAALELGLEDLGESYAQELVAKADAVADALHRDAWRNRGSSRAPVREPRWHMVGRLQRNKVRALAPHVHLWQSVDRLSLAAEIGRHAPGAAVLVQVNVAGAEQQGGCPPERLRAVVEGCRDLGLDVRGLMAIGARGDIDAVRAGFRLLRELADGLELTERSMGMSGDLEAAVAEGSTMVRVGEALFGPRRGRQAVGK